MNCPRCGAAFRAGEGSWSRCGAGRPSAPLSFAEAERRFSQFQALRRAGSLDEPSYNQALYNTMVRADDGYWLLIPEHGG